MHAPARPASPPAEFPKPPACNERAGRGRLGPGYCYRLWPEEQQNALVEHAEAEIKQADLAAFTLQLFGWGVADPSELELIDAPSTGAFKQACTLLLALGAINDEDSKVLSEHGKDMLQIPAHPRLAHMLLCADACGAIEQAALLAALLSERDPFGRGSADLELRLKALKHKQTGHRTGPNAFGSKPVSFNGCAASSNTERRQSLRPISASMSLWAIYSAALIRIELQKKPRKATLTSSSATVELHAWPKTIHSCRSCGWWHQTSGDATTKTPIKYSWRQESTRHFLSLV